MASSPPHALQASLAALLPLAASTLGPTSVSTLISLPYNNTIILSSSFHTLLATLVDQGRESNIHETTHDHPHAIAMSLLKSTRIISLDGSSRLVHYLYHALTHALNNYALPTFPSFSRALRLLRRSLLPNLFRQSLAPQSTKQSRAALTRTALATSLCNTFGEDTAFLVDLLSEYTNAEPESEPESSHESSPPTPPEAFVLIPGDAITASRVTTRGEVFLSRGLTRSATSPTPNCGRLALMHASPFTSTNAITVSPATSRAHHSSISSHETAHASAIASRLNAASVTVLVTTFVVTPLFSNALRQAGVAVVHCLPHGEMTLLANTLPCAVFDPADPGSERPMTVGIEEVSEITVRGGAGSTKYTRVVVSSATVFKQILLRGYALPKLKQIEGSAVRALGLMAAVVRPDGGEVVKGGGWAEVAMAEAVQKLCDEVREGRVLEGCGTVDKRVLVGALEIIRSGIESVPIGLMGKREFLMRRSGRHATPELELALGQPMEFTIDLALTMVDVLSAVMNATELVRVREITERGRGAIVRDRGKRRGLVGDFESESEGGSEDDDVDDY